MNMKYAFVVCCIGLMIGGCQDDVAEAPAVLSTVKQCDQNNGGITLPDGFCAQVVADQLGTARHLVVNENGDIYVAIRGDEGGVVALRDTDGDGRMDMQEKFGEIGGTGIGIWDGYLYFGADAQVIRYPLAEGKLVPAAEPEIIVNLPEQDSHASKSLAFDRQGGLFVNIGAPSNACQDPPRTPGVPGTNPCSQLERHGGVWRFDTARTGQELEDGVRYATGIRNAVALAWNSFNDTLYVVQHGRDQLDMLWPDLYTPGRRAELPAEEFFEVQEGDNFGWPYCYYDPARRQKVLAPEYGGDGEAVGRCAEYEDPIVALPAHWAPNGLVFYLGSEFPDKYRGGAFVAFHGSWNRTPLPQRGYNVVFVPFEGKTVKPTWEIFADGFSGSSILKNPKDAVFRPTGLAVGPDGAVYLSETRQGRIWRIVYVGS